MNNKIKLHPSYELILLRFSTGRKTYREIEYSDHMGRTTLLNGIKKLVKIGFLGVEANKSRRKYFITKKGINYLRRCGYDVDDSG